MNPTPIPNFDIPYLDPELIASLSSAPIYIVLTLVIFGLLALLVWLIRKEQNEQHADMTERATSAMAITELINALRGATGDQIEVSKNFSNSTENLTRLFHEQIKAMTDNTQSIRVTSRRTVRPDRKKPAIHYWELKETSSMHATDLKTG